MKPAYMTSVILAVLATVAGPTVAETKLNLLFFGNSFTNVANVPSRVQHVAAADGHPRPRVISEWDGGSDLDHHIDEVTTKPKETIAHPALPAGKTFDFVIMQGHSVEATAKLGDGTFSEDALRLYKTVKNHESGNGAKITGVLYQTWARPNLVPGRYPTLKANQAEITAGYQAACNLIRKTEGANSCRIAPVGQTFELGGFDKSLYGRDRYHASVKGATLAALVLYRTIYNEKVGDISFAAAKANGIRDLSEADWTEITALADKAPISLKAKSAAPQAANSAAPRPANPVYEGQAAEAARMMPANRARVTEALKAAGLPQTPVVWYAVPPMSDLMRLHYTYPVDGRLNGDLRIVAAQDEFEPASFQLYSFADRKNVTLTASPLKGKDGATMPASALDIKVVKLWFQNGNGWISYFADVGMKLIPELLLHDENMVRVDLDEPANYARLKDDDGERFVWISPPIELARADTFDPVREPFADSKTLQPVAMKAGEFKQFFATLHAPKGQTPGVYTGTITVAEGGKTLCTIPVNVRVLPFELPRARTHFDLDREMIISVMCARISLSSLMQLHGCDAETAKRLYGEYLVNLRNHGMTHAPGVDQTAESIKMVQEYGFQTKPLIEAKNFCPWFGKNGGGRLTFDNMMTAKAAAKKCADFYRGILGHTDVMSGHGDEQGAAFVATYRNIFKYYHDHGIRIGCSGHASLMNKGGYTYGFYPMGGAPDAQESIRPWNEIGDKYVGFYASQHTGSENPQYIRRQNGLLGYFNNLSLLYNYEFKMDGWNDMGSSLYKPMVVALYNQGGVVDTLQWEGYREAADDMRYATYLKLLANKAVQSGNTERKLAGKKALQYLALLKPATMDLNVVRAEMIEHIMKLRAMQ